MRPGDRVRIKIRDRAAWNRAYADALDSATGTVEDVRITAPTRGRE